MAASKKAIDNAQRLRYIRALERFHKGMVSYLMNTPELTHKGYDKKIDNSLKLLNRIEEIDLYKGELKDLQTLVKKMISYKESQNDIQSIKEELLHSSNQLDKNKNARRYKKEKHSSSVYDDWA
jgi:hypothetical protein